MAYSTDMHTIRKTSQTAPETWNEISKPRLPHDGFNLSIDSYLIGFEHVKRFARQTQKVDGE
jgi:hypothetical protein